MFGEIMFLLSKKKYVRQSIPNVIKKVEQHWLCTLICLHAIFM